MRSRLLGQEGRRSGGQERLTGAVDHLEYFYSVRRQNVHYLIQELLCGCMIREECVPIHKVKVALIRMREA